MTTTGFKTELVLDAIVDSVQASSGQLRADLTHHALQAVSAVHAIERRKRHRRHRR